jgi:hypothetical protein
LAGTIAVIKGFDNKEKKEFIASVTASALTHLQAADANVYSNTVKPLFGIFGTLNPLESQVAPMASAGEVVVATPAKSGFCGFFWGL